MHFSSIKTSVTKNWIIKYHAVKRSSFKNIVILLYFIFPQICSYKMSAMGLLQEMLKISSISLSIFLKSGVVVVLCNSFTEKQMILFSKGLYY